MFLTSNANPVGLKRRIAYAFVLLISCMAIVSALAVKNAFEYAETTLTGEYLSDINDALIQVLNEGGAIRMPLTMKVYCDNPDSGMEPVPERYKFLSEGYSEVAEPPAVFAFRSQWQGHALVVVRDQESFEKTEQKMWLFSAITVIAVVFLPHFWEPCCLAASCVRSSVFRRLFVTLPAATTTKQFRARS